MFYKTMTAGFCAVALTALGCGGSNKEAEDPSALEEDGPMEDAGESVDETAEDVEEGTEEAVDETGEAMEDAGEELSDDEPEY